MEPSVEKIIDFLDRRLGITGVTPSTLLFSDGTVDSIGMLELVSHLEEVFEIDVDPGDVTLDNFDTPERVARYVQLRQNGALLAPEPGTSPDL